MAGAGPDDLHLRMGVREHRQRLCQPGSQSGGILDPHVCPLLHPLCAHGGRNGLHLQGKRRRGILLDPLHLRSQTGLLRRLDLLDRPYALSGPKAPEHAHCLWLGGIPERQPDQDHLAPGAPEHCSGDFLFLPVVRLQRGQRPETDRGPGRELHVRHEHPLHPAGPGGSSPDHRQDLHLQPELGYPDAHLRF